MDKIRTFGEALEFLTRILKPPNEKSSNVPPKT